MSARRAGLVPWTADLFCDSDLVAIAPNARRCPFDRYPDGLLDELKQSPDQPFIYTGGLEARPDLIARMAEVRPLWGNAAESVRLARDPFFVATVLRDHCFPVTEVRRDPPMAGEWLRKPFAGSGGHGITRSSSGDQADSHYFQQFIEGTPMSVTLVRSDRGTQVLGATRQLIGPIDWLNAPAFRYAGNVSIAVPTEITEIGDRLGEACQLRGLFGIDFIWHDDRPWVVEINPRYSASIELLEAGGGFAALAWHARAFGMQVDRDVKPTVHSRSFGKAILYAGERFAMPAHPEQFGQWSLGESPRIADVPHAGDISEPGWPVLTVFADAESDEACEHELRTFAYEVARSIGLRMSTTRKETPADGAST